ncbi:hypothetical protein [Engelhardtia mirabilis]|uniref:hypothetical protein n=1 Tax=Engelhardtia mirabilis TaxID=2528011 RepID=UPI00119FEF22
MLGGSAFIVDENHGGTANSMRIVDVAWGRLVDVYDTRPTSPDYASDPLEPQNYTTRLVYPDFVVGEDVRTAFEAGQLKWELTSNPVNGRFRLRIGADAEQQQSIFAVRVAQASQSLDPIDPKGLSPAELPPYSMVARNAALVVRFDDLLDVGSIGLHSTVEVFAGNPPVVPFDARVLPDLNHGGVAQVTGKFHPTRLIVDLTISQDELATITPLVAANGLGLPASADSLAASVALRFPTVISSAYSQFAVLSNVKGTALNTDDSGAFDYTSPTGEVVWAMRAGNSSDDNNGFLVDFDQPRVVGSQPVTITQVTPILGTGGGLAVSVSLEFGVAGCALDPVPGDLLKISPELELEVTAPATLVGSTAVNVPLVLTPGSTEVDPAVLVGLSALYQTPWRDSLGAQLAPCFVRFSPSAGQLPAGQVEPQSQVIVRFSEAMDPASARPFDTFYVARSALVDASLSEAEAGALIQPPKPGDLVLGDTVPSPDFREVRFAPTLPMTHDQGSSESYFFNLVSGLDQGGLTDLAGNVLADVPGRIEFRLDPSAPSEDTGGWVLRFNAADEDGLAGTEVRGQVLWDESAGVLRPRPVQRFAAVVDRSQPMVSTMQPIPLGLQTPLSSQGSKVHLMWRYMDMGFSISQTDDLFMNLDLEGMALSPYGGSVVSTIYDQFELSLGHARNLPDEFLIPPPAQNFGLPMFPGSGFVEGNTFEQNYLPDPKAGRTVMHERELGYAVSNSGVFLSGTGTPMLQMPWNVGLPEDQKRFYTWRDTAITTFGNVNPNGELVAAGVPTMQEQTVLGLSTAGDVWGPSINDAAGKATKLGVPAVALPLLMEFRCYPTEQSSLNNFDVSIAVPSSPQPYFRAFSTGGTNASGNLVNKDPEQQISPTGGFNGNPLLPPLGAKTIPRDPTVYIGQADVVIRTSRAYTILMDAEQSPTTPIVGLPWKYEAAVVEPSAAEQPNGTAVVLAWRGDGSPSIDPVESAMFDAGRLDVFGEPLAGPLTAEVAAELVHPWVDPSWHSSLAEVSGSRFVQTRFTFLSSTASDLRPWLDSYGLAFER